MTRRMTAALLAGVMTLGSVLVSASQAPQSFDYARYRAWAVAREVRQAARDAQREMRRALRQAKYEARDDARSGTARASRAAARDTRLDARERERERTARAFRQVGPGDDPCADGFGGDRGRACEVRDTRLPAPAGPLVVDAARNGGVRVEGWDQPDVLVRAVVQATGDTDDDAKRLLPQVRVTAAGDHVGADGPATDDNERRGGWSVSFRIWAPRATALALTARNGGVTVRGMHGESRFSTQNGGVTLDDVSGQVVGTTRNGGVKVRLTGAGWQGAGLDVETTNGGVTLDVPANYSAALEVHTQNGGIRTDVPLTTQDRRARELRTTLGSGGPLLKLRTVNGGVRIDTR